MGTTCQKSVYILWPVYMFIQTDVTVSSLSSQQLFNVGQHQAAYAHVVRMLFVGYLISCGTDQVAVAMSISPLIIMPFMLFGGLFLNSGSVIILIQK